MDIHTISNTIITLEKAAMAEWLNGNPTPFLNLYSKNFTYFDPSLELRLDGFDNINEMYEKLRGLVKSDRFEMVNPVVQSTETMAVLSYNLHIFTGETLWKENCTEIYQLEENNEWKIIHCHFSPTKPTLG